MQDFQQKSTISEHLKHIFEEGELNQNSVVRFFRTTAADGKSYNTAHRTKRCSQKLDATQKYYRVSWDVGSIK